MSEYSFASKSTLKLKGVDPAITKKKKKKNKDKEREREEAIQALEHTEEGEEGSSSTAESAQFSSKLTKAEIAHKLRLEDREKDRIKKRATLNHKEKVEKFNSYLASLSEHYDIPKVSWTK